MKKKRYVVERQIAFFVRFQRAFRCPDIEIGKTQVGKARQRLGMGGFLGSRSHETNKIGDQRPQGLKARLQKRLVPDGGGVLVPSKRGINASQPWPRAGAFGVPVVFPKSDGGVGL